MKTFLKLEGNVKDGIKALEKLALDTPDVCIMNTYIQSEAPMFNTQTGIMDYFAAEGDAMEKRCSNIISKSKDLNGYDFVFEWFIQPSKGQREMILKKIEDTLKPLGVKYTYIIK
jgi:hypothetical protein